MEFPFDLTYPITDNDTKCRISEGCFFAIGSYSRYLLEKVDGANDKGVDFRVYSLQRINNLYRTGNQLLDFQLKSTSGWEISDDKIVYDLSSKNYNDMIYRNKGGDIKIILILLCLPKNDEAWFEGSYENMLFRNCMYWYNTEETEILPNSKSTKRIFIPRENLLTVVSFHHMVSQFSIKRL